MKNTKYILASTSPRRKELFKKVVCKFDVIASDIEESSHNTRPHLIVQDLAKQKCMAVAQEFVLSSTNSYHKASDKTPNSIIIGADTLVVYKDQILGKPKDKNQAYEMLKTLQNNWHAVYTGICVYSTKQAQTTSFYDKTKVHMTTLTDKQINDYIATESPMDKAGAYGIQDLGGALIDKIIGSYDNVMGLPTEMLKRRLNKQSMV